MLPIVVVTSVRQCRVNQGRKHVDQCREQVAATQTILIYCKDTVHSAISDDPFENKYNSSILRLQKVLFQGN